MRSENATLLQRVALIAVGCAIGDGTSLLLRPGAGSWSSAAGWFAGVATVVLAVVAVLARSVRTAGRAEVTRAVAAAVQSERVALARDLHDTVSHHLSAVGVHAAAARLSFDGLSPVPARAVSSLQQIELSSRSAMADLRRMLGLLHGNEPESTPRPALDTLDDLVRGGRSAGLGVDLRLNHVRPESLPDSLSVAAYRIIQETLTNALRHGDGALDLTVTQTSTELRIIGSNAIANSHLPIAGSGRGLDGMRHRADLFGGSASIGPDPDQPGTWNTCLTFPLRKFL